MSNSNRYEKSPNPKVARYLHRIEQLVGNRGRTPSPLASRISKPMKPSTLDSFLKYELTFKILLRFFEKNNRDFMRHFMNSLRETYEHRVEKIYRFVSIEKSQCTHLHVDITISSKILYNSLKNYLRKNIKIGFQAIKLQKSLSQSVLIFNTPRSMISRRENQKREGSKYKLVIALFSIFTNKKNQFFNYFKDQITEKDLKKIRHVSAAVLIHSLKNIMKKRESHFFQLLINQVNYSKEEDRKDSKAKQKIYNYGVSKDEKVKALVVYSLLKVLSQCIIQKKDNKIAQYQLKEKEMKQSKVISTSGLIRVDYDIYQATARINTALISAISRIRASFFKKTQILAIKKRIRLEKLQKIGNKIVLLENCSAFGKIMLSSNEKLYLCSKEIVVSQNGAAFQIITILNTLNRKNFNVFFKKLSKISERKFQKAFDRVFRTFILIFYREGLRKISTYSKNSRIAEQKVRQEGEIKRQEAKYLIKCLNKLYFNKIVPIFIKINLSKKTKKPQIQTDDYNWKKQMQSFLSERNNFNQNLAKNILKVDNLLQEQRVTPQFKDSSPLVLNSPKRSQRGNGLFFS